MSIKIQHRTDGTIAIECGGQTVILYQDGEPIATPKPVRLKPIRGKGAGHQALDIPLTGDAVADDEETLLNAGDEFDLEDLAEPDSLYES